MVNVNYNLKRLIRTNIRMLKREYGHDITLYKLNSATTNLDSGVKSATHTSVYIRRAIVLPATVTRSVIQTISIISANKQILQGGTFDAGVRVFIIDRSDAPTISSLGPDDWLVFDGKRYDVKKVDEYEYNTSWLVSAKEVKGVDPEEDFYAPSSSFIEFTQTATAVVV
jgi:hypothetical protein